MRHLAMTGIETAAMISRIFLGLAIRATPPSAMVACAASVTSMMTPPLSISARPVLRRRLVVLEPLFWDMVLNPWIPFREREEWARRALMSILQRGVARRGF